MGVLDWLNPVAGGVSLAAGLLGHDNTYHGPTKGNIDQALALGHSDPFSFNLDENDPELASMRRGIIQGGANNRRSSLDDLSRAGLLGSSAGLGILHNNDLDTERGLEGAYGSVYGSRRGEAHGDYVNNMDWKQHLASQVLGANIDAGNANSRSAAEGMGALGEFGGSLVQDYWRKKFLGPSHYDQGPSTFTDGIKSGGAPPTPVYNPFDPGHDSAWY